MNVKSQNPWICCQLGAREHYAIPRALYRAGCLELLITDAWISPHSFIHYLPGSASKSLGDRHHPDLTNAPIKAFTNSLVQFETRQRIFKTADWERMISRNQWFQKRVIKFLEKVTFPENTAPILFTYSYAALEILNYAKKRGWRTILGQIDPGIREEEIVKAEQAKYPELAPQWQSVPPDYWRNWQQECVLADQIMVNSQWSKKLLEEVSIEPTKIKVVPLMYEAPSTTEAIPKIYPIQFSQERPFRVLFLGLVSIRKGIAACLDAIKLLTGEAIEFWFVGTLQINIPEEFKNHPQIRWIGAVPRSQTADYYQKADIFLFPTLSDGFGLTQLEALAWQLPVIASKNCGEVIENQVNGLILEEVTGHCIAQKIRESRDNLPILIERLRIANSLEKFDLNHLIVNLENLF